MLAGCGRDLNRPGLVECAAPLGPALATGYAGDTQGFLPASSLSPPPRAVAQSGLRWFRLGCCHLSESEHSLCSLDRRPQP